MPATIDLPHSAYTRPSNCARPSTKRSTRPCRYGHLPAMGPAASGGCTDGPSAAAGARVQGRGAATAASPRSAAGPSLSPPPATPRGAPPPVPGSRRARFGAGAASLCPLHAPLASHSGSLPDSPGVDTSSSAHNWAYWQPQLSAQNRLPTSRQRTNAQHASPTAHNSQRVQLVAPPLTVKADGNVLV